LKFRPECFQLALLICGEALPFNCKFCIHWKLVRAHVAMELPLNWFGGNQSGSSLGAREPAIEGELTTATIIPHVFFHVKRRPKRLKGGPKRPRRRLLLRYAPDLISSVTGEVY
jgi:hypothetical protein